MKDKARRWFVKIVFVFFMVEMALSFIAEALRSVTTMQLIIGGIMISAAAYLIRERRVRREKRPRSAAGGERTPVMPRPKL